MTLGIQTKIVVWNHFHRRVTLVHASKPCAFCHNFYCIPYSTPATLAMSSEILQCLASSLNTDPNVRMSAELRLNQLFANPGPSHRDYWDDCHANRASSIVKKQVLLSPLSQFRRISTCLWDRWAIFLTSPQSKFWHSSFIHSAVIILHKYVKERWTPIFQSFKGNAPSVEVVHSLVCLV